MEYLDDSLKLKRVFKFIDNYIYIYIKTLFPIKYLDRCISVTCLNLSSSIDGKRMH